MLQQYTVVVERSPNNYSAYLPDVPGCVTTGRTLDEIRANMVEALTLHFAGIVEDGDPVPMPATRPEDVTDLEPDDQVILVAVETPGGVAAAR